MPTGSYQGKLVDAITGDPVTDIRLIAKAEPASTDMTCQVFEGATGADGNFMIEGLCGGNTYRLEAGQKFLLFEGLGLIEGGVPSTSVVTTKVWRSPGAGVYIIEGTKMNKQSTVTDVGSKQLYESEEKVYYPDPLPKTATKITAGQYLGISGDPDSMKFYPLVESGERTFGTKDEPDKEDPWSYIGIRFESDTEWERLEGKPDPSKVLEIKQGKRHTRYVEGTALPAGMYAVMKEGDRRTYLFEFTG